MQDDQLIFMISLPRSGSTMLQKILGNHSDIYTRSEPWLMLHPLYALKSEGIQTRYGAKLAAIGVQDFLQELPVESKDYYHSKLRECYLSLYSPYLTAHGKTRFLDKTPRYYEVFDELQETFPNAKFIILYRNPLAVFCSMLETWVKGDYDMIKSYKCDLFGGVEFLKRDFSTFDNTCIVKYEDLLLNPAHEIKVIFDFLELPNQQNCIEYTRQEDVRWKYGDPITVYEKNRPDAQHATAWHAQLAKAETRKLLSEYLSILGPTTFSILGYSFIDAQNTIRDAENNYPNTHVDSSICLSTLLLSDTELLKQIQRSNAKLESDIESLQKQVTAHETLIKEKDHQIQNKNEQIQLRDEIIKDIEEKLKHSNGNLAEATIAITELNHQLLTANKKLESCQALLIHEQQLSEELLQQLDVILRAAKDLTEHHIYTHPSKKLKAYKQLLNCLNLIRRKHI
jgi:hypothetical protein